MTSIARLQVLTDRYVDALADEQSADQGYTNARDEMEDAYRTLLRLRVVRKKAWDKLVKAQEGVL